MKNFSKLLLVAAVMFFAACSKENTEVIDVYADPEALIGKWKLSETMADPGNGSMNWQKVPKSRNEYIEFKADGQLAGNKYVDFKTYTVQDSSIITFKKADGVTYFNLSYKLTGGVLQTSPAGPTWCIEACGTRYKKIE